MNINGKNIVSRLADLLSLQGKTKEELQAIVQRYPYFALARFMLSNKFKDEEDLNAEKQMQKTAMYFSNALWFDYLTTDKEIYTTDSSNESLSTFEQTVEEFSEANNIDAATNASKEIEQPIPEDPDETVIDDETEIVDSRSKEPVKLSKLIEQYLSEFKRPVDENGEMPIETKVYHAIDYFASQGIKLEPGQINQDMFGAKVKKFTDWLKQIKQANQNPTDLGTDAQTEHLIEKIAQTSNEAKDVVTETMAEVLLKQGKTEKAIQLYKKLSFLDPSKSTYFAAKINELKDLP
jgi:tetratricopeptide (TPR) repeat protein